MNEWEEATLGNLAEVQTGPFGSQLKNEQYIKGGTPVVTVEHIKDFLIEDFVYPSVTNEDKNRLKKYTLKPGDIVFSRVGSVDLSALVKKHQSGWLFSSRMLRVRVKEKLDTDFLAYYLRQSNIRQFIINISVGSTMPSINTEILKSLPIAYCPLEEQKRIAATLSCLDRKIENLRKQNETLEAIAQTLFKHWFVDFEFPNEDGKPYKSSGGAMERSELGEIPMGWRVTRLSDHIEIQHGYSFRSEDFSEDGNPIVRMGNFLTSGGLDFGLDKTKFVRTEINKKFWLSPHDLVVALSDITQNGIILGNPGFIPSDGKQYLLNQRVGKIDSTGVVNKIYLYCLMKTKMYKFWLISSANSTTVLNTSPSRIGELLISLPLNNDLLNELENTIKPFFKKIESNRYSIQILTKIRDVLLPKLMSGKLRITE